MNGEQILKIDKVGDLFPNNEQGCKQKYKELIKIWHPDVSNETNATEVFQHIKVLYEEALKQIANNVWEKTNYKRFETTNGKTIEMSYLYKKEFELGEYYVMNNCLVYILDSDKEKYYNNAIERIKSIKYANDDMKKNLSVFMPTIKNTYKLKNGKFCIVLTKTKEVYPLSLVLKHFNNDIPEKHTAWMISRLSNICCLLKYNEIVHNGINVDNCFVSLDYHSIMLLGGWWYSTKENEKMIGITKENYDIIPIAQKNKKVSSYITDLESVKMIGRKLLNCKNTREVQNKNIPKAYQTFLIDGASNDAYMEFDKWDKALTNSYGKREFLKISITPEVIYKK